MKRFFLLLAAMMCFGINVYAGETCSVLDVNGNKTTETVMVWVSEGSDATKGKVRVGVSSDSPNPINAYITITVGGKVKLNNEPIRIEPSMSGVKDFTIAPSKGSVQVDISGAKCLR
jgi:hypothetical protein